MFRREQIYDEGNLKVLCHSLHSSVTVSGTALEGFPNTRLLMAYFHCIQIKKSLEDNKNYMIQPPNNCCSELNRLKPPLNCYITLPLSK